LGRGPGASRALRLRVVCLDVGSERDLELLRRVYSEWARGDFSGVDIWDANVKFITAGIEPRTYLGPDGVREGWFDFLSAWNDFRVEGTKFIEGTPDDTYLVLCHLRGSGKESSLPIEADTANVIVMRAGKIVRFELFWDRDEAVAAAGLA
jgi:ketosteroid isomerase-like protein